MIGGPILFPWPAERHGVSSRWTTALRTGGIRGLPRRSALVWTRRIACLLPDEVAQGVELLVGELLERRHATLSQRARHARHVQMLTRQWDGEERRSGAIPPAMTPMPWQSVQREYSRAPAETLAAST